MTGTRRTIAAGVLTTPTTTMSYDRKERSRPSLCATTTTMSYDRKERSRPSLCATTTTMSYDRKDRSRPARRRGHLCATTTYYYGL